MPLVAPKQRKAKAPKRRFFRYVRSPNRYAPNRIASVMLRSPIANRLRPRRSDSVSTIPDDVEPWIAEAMAGGEYEVVPTGDNIASPVPDAADLAEQAELDWTADLITDEEVIDAHRNNRPSSSSWLDQAVRDSVPSVVEKPASVVAVGDITLLSAESVARLSRQKLDRRNAVVAAAESASSRNQVDSVSTDLIQDHVQRYGFSAIGGDIFHSKLARRLAVAKKKSAHKRVQYYVKHELTSDVEDVVMRERLKKLPLIEVKTEPIEVKTGPIEVKSEPGVAVKSEPVEMKSEPVVAVKSSRRTKVKKIAVAQPVDVVKSEPVRLSRKAKAKINKDKWKSRIKWPFKGQRRITGVCTRHEIASCTHPLCAVVPGYTCTDDELDDATEVKLEPDDESLTLASPALETRVVAQFKDRIEASDETPVLTGAAASFKARVAAGEFFEVDSGSSNFEVFSGSHTKDLWHPGGGIMRAGSDEASRLMCPVPTNRFDDDSDSASDSASSWLVRARATLLNNVKPEVLDIDSDDAWGEWPGAKRSKPCPVVHRVVPPPPPPPPRRSKCFILLDDQTAEPPPPPRPPPVVSVDVQTVVAEAEINLRLALQAEGFSHVVLKDDRGKQLAHVPNGYLVQLIREHTSGRSQIRTHDDVVGWVESANLKIASANCTLEWSASWASKVFIFRILGMFSTLSNC